MHTCAFAGKFCFVNIERTVLLKHSPLFHYIPAEQRNSKLTESLLKPFIGELVGPRIFHSRVGLDHPHVRLPGRPVAQRVGTRIFRKAQLQG